MTSSKNSNLTSKLQSESLLPKSTPNDVSRTNTDVAKSSESGFSRYLKEIQSFPLLTPEEEYEYGMKYKETGDPEAAKMLLQSHLRLVVKMAAGFKQYGLPITDLVSEGNVGLIQAVKKFDPEKGFRFSTYAMWWIRANIQEYILKSWSLVKIGTTAAQKKLFFNLHKIKKNIRDASVTGALESDHVEIIAKDLNVSKKDVVDMDSRLQQSDSSLNAIVGDADSSEEVVNFIAADQESQEEIAIENQEKSRQEMMLEIALEDLNEREKDIVIKRLMSEKPLTLEELSQTYKVSRERIRQIEANAIDKIKKAVSKLQKQFSLN